MPQGCNLGLAGSCRWSRSRRRRYAVHPSSGTGRGRKEHASGHSDGNCRTTCKPGWPNIGWNLFPVRRIAVEGRSSRNSLFCLCDSASGKSPRFWAPDFPVPTPPFARHEAPRCGPPGVKCHVFGHLNGACARAPLTPPHPCHCPVTPQLRRHSRFTARRRPPRRHRPKPLFLRAFRPLPRSPSLFRLHSRYRCQHTPGQRQGAPCLRPGPANCAGGVPSLEDTPPAPLPST